jgi:methylenetetrahydrofolate dehydrogenase (NADP+) / methenyltetrahydrofolate cyclohydrolase
VPASAEAVMAILDHHEVALAGRQVVVVGRSTVVGKRWRICCSTATPR